MDPKNTRKRVRPREQKTSFRELPSGYWFSPLSHGHSLARTHPSLSFDTPPPVPLVQRLQYSPLAQAYHTTIPKKVSPRRNEARGGAGREGAGHANEGKKEGSRSPRAAIFSRLRLRLKASQRERNIYVGRPRGASGATSFQIGSQPLLLIYASCKSVAVTRGNAEKVFSIKA